LNALLLKERAIVTPIPGTTRDLIEDIIHIKGVKIRVFDTAGLRIPMDVVEEAGIEKVRQKIPKTDLIIWILDSSGQYTNEDEDIYKSIATKRKIVALNKIDLPGNIDTTALQSKGLQWLEVSALKDMGLEQLKGEIYRILMEKGAKGGGELITNERHRDALKKSSEALKGAISVMKTNGPLEITAFELRQSLFHLGEITGETCPDDILHDIFERFCIGK
jgi:tRNA modification GTPase